MAIMILQENTRVLTGFDDGVSEDCSSSVGEKMEMVGVVAGVRF